MTREEALKVLDTIPTIGEQVDALEMAIEALEQQPCEDCISRQALRQKLQEHHDFFISAYGSFKDMPLEDKARVDEITNCIAMVVNEPPVTPQPKTGRWMDGTCSECGKTCLCDGWGIDIESKYCPKCGAKMEVKE